MINFEIISARHVVAFNNEVGSVDLEVQFAHLPGQFIPFTARKDDETEHGRELYVRAVFGEFGDVTHKEFPAYVPSAADQQRKLERLMSEAALRIAPLQDAKTLGVATDTELARLEVEQRYRITLMRLPESDGWPTEVSWPEAPR